MLTLLIKQVPVVGQTYVKTAIKVSNSTSPIEVVKVTALSIVDGCIPTQFKYAIFVA